MWYTFITLMGLVCWHFVGGLRLYSWDSNWPMAFPDCSRFGVICDMVLVLRVCIGFLLFHLFFL